MHDGRASRRGPRFRWPTWRFLALRLSEAGTWRAIGVALLAVDIQIPDATWRHLTLAGAAIAALVGVFLPEMNSPVTMAAAPRTTGEACSPP